MHSWRNGAYGGNEDGERPRSYSGMYRANRARLRQPIIVAASAGNRLTSEANKGDTMHFKLIIALVEDDKTDAVLAAAREVGATGATVINQARGQGLEASKTFFGLGLETQRDVLMFLVEEHLSRKILETIAQVGRFDESPGAGIAFQIDVDDAVGVSQQIRKLTDVVEEEI
jgi:nitrogen regulatory protein PII